MPFCPLIKGECKEKDCVMWEEFEDDDGRLVKFCKLVECIDSLNILLMDKINLNDEDFEDEELSEEDMNIEDEKPSEKEEKVEELNSKSAEDICNELFEYAIKRV